VAALANRDDFFSNNSEGNARVWVEGGTLILH